MGFEFLAIEILYNELLKLGLDKKLMPKIVYLLIEKRETSYTRTKIDYKK